MRTDELDYHLPEELIASTPADRRDQARLLVYRRDADQVEHRRVSDLPSLLRDGDLLVLNETRVLPARFNAVRTRTGGRLEGLYLDDLEAGQLPSGEVGWRLMLQSGGRLIVGESIALLDRDHQPSGHELELTDREADGVWHARVHSVGETDAAPTTQTVLEMVGYMPLPPYIRKQRGTEDAATNELDRERYQTVYARQVGSVAAPTAGLHFTDALLGELAERGVQTARLSLHVGLGTFAPVRVDDLAEHDMHTERFSVPAQTIDALGEARRDGRRVIPIGTTSVRALESLPDPLPALSPGQCYQAGTDLFITPGYAFRFCDGLMTNFHLPRSTLIALVAARIGLERLRSLYDRAIEQRYRFYSYGDAMLVL